MNSILYISLTGMTEPLGRSQVLEYLMDLSKKENKFYLISFEREKNSDYINQVKEITKKHDIEWHHFTYSNRYGVLSTISQLFRSIRLGKNMINKGNINIIHARSFIPALIGFILAKKSGAKFIYDIRGFSMEEKVDSGRISKDSYLYKFLNGLETFLYKQSDFIVSLTLNAKNELIKKYKINSSIISIIPTCANRELFKIISHHERLLIRKQLGFEENDLIIIHTGTTQNRYDFNKEVKVFKFLKERIERLKFLIVTKDSREIIQKVFDKENIGKSNFKIISSSLPEMYKYLNIADFSIFFIPPTYAKKAMAPTKFAENVACYLPSITNRGVGDMEFYLDRYKVGKLVDLENIDYAEILDFVNNRETYIDKKDFDELFNSYFDKKIAVEKYNNIYKRIVSEE